MKKFFVTLTSLILICIIFIGCSQTDANIETSKSLNKNLNLLTNTINRLDTVDNAYLINNDLYSIDNLSINTVPSPYQTGKAIKLANSTNVIIDDKEIQSKLKDALSDEIINRLFCDSEGNCKLCNEKYVCDDTGKCIKCNQSIICDSEGNCTHCGKLLTIKDSTCSECGANCTSNDSCSSLDINTINNLKNISDINKSLEFELLNVNNDRLDVNCIDVYGINYADNTTNTNTDNTNNTINFIGDFENKSLSNNLESSFTEQNNVDNIINTSETLSNENEIISNESEESINTINNDNITNTDSIYDNENNSDDPSNTLDNNFLDNDSSEEEVVPPTIKYYYYSEESFNPSFLRYKPRFINNVNYSSANSNIERYIEKLQKLYTMTADVVEANNTLANYKILILNDIDEAKKLNNCILSGECTPTNNQRQALDNYIVDIRNTINHLRNCNGELTNEINKISSSNTGITNSIDVTNSNYLRILNHIDTRISYHENAIATLEQIKFILEDTQNNNDTSIDIEDLNSNIKDEIIDNFLDHQDSQTTNDNTDTIEKDDADISNIDDTLNNTQDNYGESNEIIIIVDDSIDNIENSLGSDDTITEGDNNSIDSVDEVYNDFNEIDDESFDNDIDNDSINNPIDNETNNINENHNINESEANATNDNDDEEKTTNIDTYHEAPLNNLDLLHENSDNNNNAENTGNITPTNNLDNSEIVDSNIINNPEQTQETTDENVFNTSSAPQMVGSDIVGSNELEYNNFGNNLNNLHENTIISQNNINGNDLENNAYHYDDNGHLYNNTNGYDTNNINNINNKNNNVNTYKYNTLIDSINRGTVNNGINNLSIWGNAL